MKREKLAILGSTGSIGVQTLDIVRENPDRFEIITLTANRNWEQLAHQAIEFDVDSVVIADEQFYTPLKEALAHTDIKVFAGEHSVEESVCNSQVDTVVNALVGYAGMIPTVRAIEYGKKVALANKESLVVAGEMIMPLAIERKTPILPIDSEHSAIFQCLMGEQSPLRRLIITCSGGAFRDFPREALDSVTPEQALKHPLWSMGAKITIDSATLVNKGFEVIEAHHLFGVGADQISVILHPEAIIHSMVEFEDGALKAQLGTPDMHMPISLALMFPERAVRPTERFNFTDHPTLTFREVDRVKYPALDIAYDCLRRKGTAACTMNGANEVAVAAFLNHKCAYNDIVRAIEFALEKATFVAKPTLEDYAKSNEESRVLAQEFLKL
ncbi:MAG: 1-deoxy-D-xylulose-5-phosphate reductoisomerase [Alistipes sp.]|nr:1-deoxy-D-xylulose-5-phosphate reductoisomerase [Alistipes sp.]